MSAARTGGVRSGVVQCGQGRCGGCKAQRTRPQDEQRGVFSDNLCIRATMEYSGLGNEREKERRRQDRKQERPTYPGRNIYRGTSTQHCRGLSSYAFGLLVRGGRPWRRPSKSSSSLWTGALRGRGSGVAALAFPFPFPGDPEGGWTPSERRELQETHFRDGVASC